MRRARAKIFPKTKPQGQRNAFILLLRSLLSRDSLLLFLRYEGGPSEKLNELRYLAANHQVTVHLLLKKWLPSIGLQGLFPEPCLLLCGAQEESLGELCQREQFLSLLEDFPFLALSHRGILSQEPFFSSLSSPRGGRLTGLLLLLQYHFAPIVSLPLTPWESLLVLLDLQSKLPPSHVPRRSL